MTIESKSKKVTVQHICRATCDNCKEEIDSITLYDERKKTEQQLVTSNMGLDGINLKFKAGYGTTYDMSDFELTLCTNCFAEMVRQFGGVIRQ